MTGIMYCNGVPAGETHIFDGDPVEYISITNGNKAGAANNPASAYTSNMTDLSSMPWPDKANFNEPLNHWDVSNVINVNGMFNRALLFNQSLNSWATGNVTDMGALFNKASSVNQPLDNWDTSSVRDMNSMFSGASSFNQDLSSWCVSQIGSKPSILKIAPCDCTWSFFNPYRKRT